MKLFFFSAIFDTLQSNPATPCLYIVRIICGLLTKREVKMAGIWPSSVFACLWTETNINSQKKNVANIQPP